MRSTPPSFILFLISLAYAVLALLPIFGIAIVTLPLSRFWLMTAAKDFWWRGCCSARCKWRALRLVSCRSLRYQNEKPAPNGTERGHSKDRSTASFGRPRPAV